MQPAGRRLLRAAPVDRCTLHVARTVRRRNHGARSVAASCALQNNTALASPPARAMRSSPAARPPASCAPAGPAVNPVGADFRGFRSVRRSAAVVSAGGSGVSVRVYACAHACMRACVHVPVCPCACVHVCTRAFLRGAPACLRDARARACGSRLVAEASGPRGVEGGVAERAQQPEERVGHLAAHAHAAS